MGESVVLKVAEAYSRDVGRGAVRIDYEVMDVLGVSVGDVVGVVEDGRTGDPTSAGNDAAEKHRTAAKCLPLYPSDEGRKMVRMDDLGRRNAGVVVGGAVSIRKVKAVAAESVTVTQLDASPPLDARFLTDVLETIPFMVGNVVVVPYFGDKLSFQVNAAIPKAEVLVVTRDTVFSMA